MFSVLTWNILASEWIESSDYPIDEKILFNRTSRFRAILRHLSEFNADVMLLQEVMPKEYFKLLISFKNTHYVSPLSRVVWPENGVSGNVIFLRKVFL